MGIVLAGHDSSLVEGRKVYEEIGEMVYKRIDISVRVGYIKYWEPDLIEVLEEMICNGFKRIIVVPMFLLPGLHVIHEIPKLLGIKEGENRITLPDDVEIIYTSNIGADERLADIIVDKVKEHL